jgi:hypothetical protein
MEQETLRHLIRRKLADGRLPQNSIPRLWGGAGNGETCDACEEIITKTQFVMEGVSTTGGKGIQFHVGCLHIWDAYLAEVTPAQMNFQRTVPVSDGSLDRQWTTS